MNNPIRLKHLRRFAALTYCATVLLASPWAHAAAPLAGTSSPGFFRIMLGDFEITALSDGTLDLPVDQLLTNTTKDKVDKQLAQAFLESPLETSFNAFLINTGSKLVLVDTGAGTVFGPQLGKLIANLKASGYTPDQVDEIYLTHMHSDHIGGLSANGKMVFPNAIVRADRHESDFWLSQANMDKAPEGERATSKGTFRRARELLGPYLKAGHYKPFDGAVELSPGIKSYESPGHTPGHAAYVVESKGKKLMLVGDVVHVAAVQFQEPTVTISFDSDSKQAQAERIKEFTDASNGGYLIGAAHVPFPALGHIRAKGDGFEWLPVNYSQLH